eukprot:1138063-Pelagomonas_calceolata.AAC.10
MKRSGRWCLASSMSACCRHSLHNSEREGVHKAWHQGEVDNDASAIGACPCLCLQEGGSTESDESWCSRKKMMSLAFLERKVAAGACTTPEERVCVQSLISRESGCRCLQNSGEKFYEELDIEGRRLRRLHSSRDKVYAKLDT